MILRNNLYWLILYMNRTVNKPPFPHSKKVARGPQGCKVVECIAFRYRDLMEGRDGAGLLHQLLFEDLERMCPLIGYH